MKFKVGDWVKILKVRVSPYSDTRSTSWDGIVGKVVRLSSSLEHPWDFSAEFYHEGIQFKMVFMENDLELANFAKTELFKALNGE